MPDLSFEVIDVETPAFAATPTLIFKLRISNDDEQELIDSVSLRSQIQLVVPRRRYNPEEKARLLEVFGEPERWGETLHSLLWTHLGIVVPQFTGNIIVDLPVPCTYDFEVVSTKYFNALEGGDVPLAFLFTGTIFYEGEEGNVQIAQIPWSKEASFRFPITVWQEMIARYYPNTAWIRLHKDIFDRLYQYKAAHALPTWEEVFAQLLATDSEEAHL
ncbi:MAG TPA: DUF6084 family protein [Ktedonobacteraceae bacterium]|nr:DUF6084 family protein [Ktedonobacteraceae bacterium]